jgi:hypothetical protein
MHRPNEFSAPSNKIGDIAELGCKRGGLPQVGGGPAASSSLITAKSCIERR